MFSISQRTEVEERAGWRPEIKLHGSLFSWLTCCALAAGVFLMISEQRSYLPIFFAAAYAVVLFGFVRTIALWRDIFNPLCLVLAIGFLRFSCPALLLLAGAEPSEEASMFFELMGLSENEWISGHALALLGLLALIFGWVLTQERSIQSQPLKFHLPRGVKYAAIAGMLVGFMALLTFLLTNASLEVIESGRFRETTVQVGTGKYFFLAYLLITGSVLLCCYLLTNGHTWAAFIPVGIATLLYGALGGRTRAMISLAGGLLILWYFKQQQRGWRKVRLKFSYVLLASVVLVGVIWVAYVGSLYRGGFGARAFIEALTVTGLWDYVQGNIFTDLSQLHSLAGAFAIGPGVLDGATFIGSLSWPVNKFVALPGRSAGVFIVESLMGFTGEERWALNASLVGDAYLNFGIWGVVVVMMAYGSVLKFLYLKFRQGELHSAFYVLALVHGMQIFWVSIEVWPQTLTVLCFTVFLIFLGKTIFQLRPLSH